MPAIIISEINIWRSDLELRTPYRIAGENITEAENVFVMLMAGNQLTGIGTACPMPEVTGETLDYTMTVLQGAADTVRNIRIDSPDAWQPIISAIPPDAPAARAALDIAMYDLHSKALGMPCVRLWGQCHQEMTTSVTIGITDQTLAREQLKSHLHNGFRHIKLKIGDDVEKDIEMVLKIREWGGNGIHIRVDANQGYTPNAFEEFLRHTWKAGIALIEQPFAVGSDVAALPAEIREICMADEDLVSADDALKLSMNPGYKAWNIKLMKSGGMTPSKQIADIAHKSGVKLMWGCNDESCVSIAAALHIAFSCPATAWLDLDGSFDLASDIASGGFVVKDSMMRLTDKPGLGVSLRRNP